MITYESASLQELLDTAILSFGNVYAGEQFLVKDLFRGFEWNRIPKGNRTKLGSMFLNFAKKERIDEIDALGKTPQNQQIYKKVIQKEDA